MVCLQDDAKLHHTEWKLSKRRHSVSLFITKGNESIASSSLSASLYPCVHQTLTMMNVRLHGLVNMEDMPSSVCKSSRVSSFCSLMLFLINLENSTCLSRDKHQSRCKIFWSTLQCYNYENQAKPSKKMSEESINFTEKKPRFLWYFVIFPLWCFNNYKTQSLYPQNGHKYLNHSVITLLKEHGRWLVKKYVAS